MAILVARWRAPALAAALALAWPLAVGAELPADLGERLAHGYARPAAAGMVAAATDLDNALGQWCGKPDAAGAKRVQAAFADLALAWARLEPLRFGPLVQANRYERLAFWPDTRGVMPRQVQAVIAAQDADLLKPGALAGRSVAVQGLPALEFVLYGEPALLAQQGAPTFAYACGYARAVSANVAAISRDVAQAWDAKADFGRQFAQPRAGNDLYRDPQEVAAEAMKALSTGLQFARDVKLLPVLGDSADGARPRRAAFWRSGLSTRTLAAGLEGLAAFYQAGGYALPKGEDWVAGAVLAEVGNAARALREAPSPLERALGDAEGRRLLGLAALTLKNAKAIVDQDLAPALGVTIGFNALDGD
ncbi:imelysin family protein [Achromobacter ruhlandii]|uniref:imelysin family protein n=1 Tax=Achromobacter ruhlandii TaxID=72557 RepID=UPI0006C37AAA|nr:imelysin family protein [Achromobacter ruhlandii]AMG45800.1 aminopeptidase [Achromobacter xylosoxidans]CUI71997.1 Predicted periplasmic lipoprotein [Achromobacter ruhlandii]CUJ12539.1 Predicted periplasmic lipoprotein [Achromobacter ruhlandii]CUJ89749.1 Predicted periplasmic lipoprotein [Achromobacter ruhlandii]